MSRFAVGQRWISEAEPELGLGLIVGVNDKQVNVVFKVSQREVTYGHKTAPLKRVRFDVGEEITTSLDEKLEVLAVEENEGLIFYETTEGFIVETELSDHISFNRPQDRIFAGLVDKGDLFQLRYETNNKLSSLYSSPVRGLIGPRISLIAHQYYVANEVSSRALPRVLLADEVGLGKTIEAGLILHKLNVCGRAKRALIVVPDSLIYQWFLEMLRKFNLSFSVINQETYLEKGSNPFNDNELCLVSLGLLKGSELARNLLSDSTFDLMIVDEAHQLKWSEDSPSVEYEIVEDLAKRISGVLLLTATPEQLGIEGHFARLRLLDPDRFYSLESFAKEHEGFEHVAQIVKKLKNNEPLDVEENELLIDLKVNSKQDPEDVIRDLMDRHGTGRIYFRNARSVMAKEYDFFPKRLLHSYELEKPEELAYDFTDTSKMSFETKAAWLCEFLEKNKGQKVLLICRAKKVVQALDEFLRNNTSGIKYSAFHSDLSLMARDRQAAFFADPAGADILLCTEIGSEGRNFEFCHHLVMFDIPSNPDLLEQRIGRLDRIGQKCDIQIHVPHIKDTRDEVIFSWYKDGFNAFENSSRCGSVLYGKFKERLEELMINENKEELTKLVEETYKEFLLVNKELELGRDYLVEMNSFDHDTAHRVVKLVKDEDNSHELSDYMDKVFHHLGVDVDDLDGTSLFVKPSDNMFIPHFPALTSEGTSLTFDRSKAREREEQQFMTWDHPMVTGIMDLISSEPLGSVTISQRATAKKSSTVFFECFFKLACVSNSKLESHRFFPPKLIRILLSSKGEDFSEKWTKDFLDEKVVDASKENILRVMKFPRASVDKILAKGNQLALDIGEGVMKENITSMSSFFNVEINRLEELQRLTLQCLIMK